MCLMHQFQDKLFYLSFLTKNIDIFVLFTKLGETKK